MDKVHAGGCLVYYDRKRSGRPENLRASGWALLLLLICWSGPLTAGELCGGWVPAAGGGRLGFGEASGLAVSADGRTLWHVEDSGNKPRILATDRQGRETGRLKLKKSKNKDWEALGEGPCGKGRCLFVGDTGDNFRRRSSYSIYIVPLEGGALPGKVRPYRLRYTYSDGRSHNVEGLAVHPRTGRIWLFTKHESAAVFVLEAPDPASSGKAVARARGSLPVHTVTGADFHPDGGRLLLLNYTGAVEFVLSPGPGPVRILARQSIALSLQPQQEAIAWADGGRSLVVSSEKKKNHLVWMRCANP